MLKRAEVIPKALVIFKEHVINEASTVGQEALTAGRNILEDVAQGRSVKESVKEHGSEGLQKVGKKLQQCGKGKRKTIINTKIDKDSAEGVDNRITFFSVPATNVGIQRSSYKELLPLNALNQSAGPFIFRYFGDSLYLDLSKTYVWLALSLERKDVTSGEWVAITDGTGDDLTGDKFVGLAQYLGLTWIRRLTLSINGVQCFDSGIHYAYRVIIMHALGANSEVSKGLYEAALYYTDGEDQNNFQGDGFRARAERFANGKICRLFAHLDFDLARQNQLLIPHSDVIWTLYRNSDDFLIHTPKYRKNAGDPLTDNTNTYRLRLHDLRIFVKQVDLSPSLNNAIARHLEQSPAKYAQRKIEIRSVFLGKGRQEITHPTFTILEAFIGNKALSPFTFEHANLRSISVEFGGFQFPAVPYDLDFLNDNFVRAYVDMYLGMDLDSWPNLDQKTLAISMRKFASSCFFVIPMTSTLEDTNGLELIRQGTTTVKCLFNQPIKDEGYEMIIMGEFDSILSINADRILSTDGSV
ncbi:Integrase catalytic domain-containing protein [Meloidogyne graminicola]|uniref:Integrase catalytic domain-containing protein n=1 Tax=Meloidogyne graminicola TaxID=189291 RepID=A0A8S9ZSK8_9BILA|nr:Integrase catalytic domain-containing protein [Meloidogyne graminicola]